MSPYSIISISLDEFKNLKLVIRDDASQEEFIVRLDADELFELKEKGLLKNVENKDK